MKNTSISFDQCRRMMRRELFTQRQLDRDTSQARLDRDAKLLDAMLEAEGYTLPYITEWGRSRTTKAITGRARRHLELGISDLNDLGV
jgi:hypothetical protein